MEEDLKMDHKDTRTFKVNQKIEMKKVRFTNRYGIMLAGDLYLPEDADPAFAAFYNYYARRARHPRAVNFVSSWTATMLVSFWNFPLMANIKEVSPRPILLIAGENAHSRYYSEDAHQAANEPKELVIVPDADHVDLYDNMDKIPFDKIEQFFQDNLK